MIASEIFKDKKDNYPQSVPKLFVSTRLGKLQTSVSTTTDQLTCTGFILSHYEMIKQHATSRSDGENINPKVLQALGSEKMKVSRAESQCKRQFIRCL